MQPLRQSILDMEAIMSVADIYEKRATFSFEVFPPKTDVGMEKLCGKDGVLDKLYTLEPDYISCTYGAGGTNVGKNLEVLDKIQKDGKCIPCYPLHLHRQHQGRHQGKAARLTLTMASTICLLCAATCPSAGPARTAICTTRLSLSSSSARSSATSSPSRSQALPRVTSSAAVSKPTSPS